MLDRAVRRLKAGKAADIDDGVDISTEVNLHVPALLPETYCSDVHERLSLYKRLATPRRARSWKPCRKSSSTASVCCPTRPRAHPVPRGAPRRAALGVTRVDATHEAVQLQFVKNRRSTAARCSTSSARKAAPPASPARPPARRRQAPRLAGARPGGEGHPAAARRLNGDRPHFSHLEL